MATARRSAVPTIKGTVPLEDKLSISLQVSSAGKAGRRGAGRNPGLGEQPQEVAWAGFMGGFPAGWDSGPLGHSKLRSRLFWNRLG